MANIEELACFDTAVVLNNGAGYTGNQPAASKKRFMNIRIFSIRVKILLW